MKKADFMKLTNIPDVLKDIVKNAPEDADIDLISVHKDNAFPPEGSDWDKCEGCDKEHEDGLDISTLLMLAGETLEKVVDLADCKGRIAKADLGTAEGLLSSCTTTLSSLTSMVNLARKGTE